MMTHDDNDAGDVFEGLYEKHLRVNDHRPNPPTPAIQAYVDALLDRWYDLTDPGEDDTSPWADGPLINDAAGPIIYFGLRPSMADEASAICARIAAERGLNCYDPQWDCLRPTADEG